MGTTTTTVTVAALTLGLGLGAGWLAHDRLGGDAEGGAGRGRTADGSAEDLAVTPGRASPRLEGSEPSRRELLLQDEVKALRQQVTTLTAGLAEAEAIRAAAAAAAAPLDPKALRFGLGGPTPNFDKADWADLASHMAEMTKVMPRLREQLASGEAMGPELQQALGEHNMPLALFAMATASELKGTGPNGAYTHPAVIANLMRAALISANDPLSPAQEQALVTLGNAWAAEQERNAKGLAADAPALAVTVAEVDAKGRFLESAKAQLTRSQRAVLFHPETEGRLGIDLLSPALVYMLHTDAGMPKAELLPAKVISSLLGGAGVNEAEQAAFLDIGTRWVQETPSGTTPVDPRATDTMFPTVEVVQGFARAQVAATQRILDSGRLTSEQAAKVRKHGVVIIPYVTR